MNKLEGSFEEMAAETAKDVRDHADLVQRVDDIDEHEVYKRIRNAFSRLLDGEDERGRILPVGGAVSRGVNPIVIVKTALVGSRTCGQILYGGSEATALWLHETRAERVFREVLADLPVVFAGVSLAVGALKLATQASVDIPRELLQLAVRKAEPAIAPPVTCAVDAWDLEGVDRAELIGLLGSVEHPLYAPLEYKPA